MSEPTRAPSPDEVTYAIVNEVILLDANNRLKWLPDVYNPPPNSLGFTFACSIDPRPKDPRTEVVATLANLNDPHYSLHILLNQRTSTSGLHEYSLSIRLPDRTEYGFTDGRLSHLFAAIAKQRTPPNGPAEKILAALRAIGGRS